MTRPRDYQDRCICCGKIARDPHHPHPQSQGGTDKGEVPVCRDCHGLYHAICGQGLATTVKARVANFMKWMSKFPGVSLLGPTGGCNPSLMAPDWLVHEVEYYMFEQGYQDFSKGCLSMIPKVTEFKKRPPLKQE